MSKTRILGIDLGKETGIAVILGNQVADYKVLELKADTLEGRCATLHRFLMDEYLHRLVSYDLIAIEQPPYCRNPATHRQLCHYESTVWSACEKRVQPYCSFNNREIKKWFAGNGNAPKKLVMEKVLERFQLKRQAFKTDKELKKWQNAFDAIMIAAYGQWYISQIESGQREDIETIS